MLDRTIAPPIHDAVEFELSLKPYTKHVLKNGLPVYAIHAGAEDVLQLELVFAAGNSVESAPGVAAATNFMLRNGTQSKSAFELNEQFDYYGAYCTRSCYNETALIQLHTLSKHLPHLLPVLREMLTESVFPASELEIYQQNSLQRLQVNLQKSDFVANRLIDAYLYGKEHPYGSYLEADHIKQLQRDQLVAHYETYYLRGQAMLFLAGKLPENYVDQLEEAFGALTCTPMQFPLAVPQPLPVADKKYRVTNDPNGVQGAIRIARPFPNRHHPDFIPCMVLNTVLGGFFGSRLMSNIREDKGYTYGIHSYLQNHIGETAWMISTEAGKDVSEATVTEVYKEMALLRDELIDDEELLLVKNYMIGTILGDLDGPFHIIGRWKNILLNQVDEGYFNRTIDTIKKITAEELQVLAKRYLQPDDFYELIVV